MKIDCHNHTKFSPDSSRSIRELVLEALDKGVKYLAITEHMDLGFPNDKCPEGEIMFDYRITDEYFEEINRLKAELSKDIELVAGIEVGYTPEDIDDIIAHLKQYDFEYIINSVHIIRGLDCYWKGFYDGYTKKEAYEEYLQAVLDSLSAPYPFDTVGHIGYISRPAPYDDRLLTQGEFNDTLDKILKLIIAKDKILELNSSVSTLADFGALCVPDISIVKRYYELGGRKITFGSDSHYSGRVCHNYEDISAVVKKIGFKEWTIKRNGILQGVKID